MISNTNNDDNNYNNNNNDNCDSDNNSNDYNDDNGNDNNDDNEYIIWIHICFNDVFVTLRMGEGDKLFWGFCNMNLIYYLMPNACNSTHIAACFFTKYEMCGWNEISTQQLRVLIKCILRFRIKFPFGVSSVDII